MLNREVIENGDSKCSICSKSIIFNNSNESSFNQNINNNNIITTENNKLNDCSEAKILHNLNKSNKEIGIKVKLNLDNLKQIQYKNARNLDYFKKAILALKKIQLNYNEDSINLYNNLYNAISNEDFEKINILSNIILEQDGYLNTALNNNNEFVNPGGISFSLPCVAVMNRTYEVNLT